MSLKQRIGANGDALDQVAGITGIGWTASVLGYLSAVIGYGNSLVTNPQALLYLGGAFFMTTLGLDRLRSRHSEDPSE
ncbi:hypothetical protein [Halobaculum gomorrense]|uniref:Uncharacterized protein n=1 Tax=Halobaculum gomorrense TaxID=43928 RepID=A0A1M5TJH6_9EURY|nr:hypothetical protein [Halobaculum gomorrense]SHH50503.1 hypothetical protein SAMN05443636_2725 [Halobaculum gomorrense]